MARPRDTFRRKAVTDRTANRHSEGAQDARTTADRYEVPIVAQIPR